ncbi:uncharacterized protein LOC141910102 [Tubulanus polymorphus]|uniref:uncharacterized protein LOC141910102 n=1 Tax=Tubulanus polymorphus TaxID=672921 RepID=UPI003DA49D29
MHSIHDNGKEDRLFKFRVCRFSVCKAADMKILDQLRSTGSRSRIVGIATAQGCSNGREFRLNLGGIDSVGETGSFTTPTANSFTYQSTLRVTAQPSVKLLGTGSGSASFRMAQMSGGSITWTSSNVRTSGASSEVKFEGPGAALVVADVKEYRINAKRVRVEYDVVCGDGRKSKEGDAVDNFSMKTYGVAHFSAYTAHNEGNCSVSTGECIRRLEGERALNLNSAVDSFKRCFPVGSVSKK